MDDLTSAGLGARRNEDIELDADAGNVHLWRENRQADGAHLADFGLGKGEHDVEVVNHQIEHYIDIEGAGREDR